MSTEESKTQVSFKAFSKNGWDMLFTIRQEDNTKLMTELENLMSTLGGLGFTPKPQVKEPAPAAPVENKTAPSPAAPSVAAPQPPDPWEGSDNGPRQVQLEGNEILVDVIERHVTDGKASYKVKGGRYAKFGITVWPEVLDEIEDVNFEFDQNGAYIPARQTVAQYVTKTNDKGDIVPQKVIHFRPAK